MTRIRRVVLAQNLTNRSAQTVGAAVRLAAKLGAQVLGLFVEDPNLLRWAELPIAKQVSPFNTAGNHLDRERLEAQLHALSVQSQAELETAAGRFGVTCSFQVVRGEIGQVFTSLEPAEDLLVLTTQRQVLGLKVYSPSSLASVLGQVQRSMLLLPQHSSFREPLVVLHSASLKAEAVLDVALSIREAGTQPLTVLITGDEAAMGPAMQAWQTGRKVRVRTIYAGQVGLERLAHIQALSGCDGLVLGADSPLLTGEGLQRWLTFAQTPVLVLQSTEANHL
ncbi:MAG: hypothetical protein SFU83_24385 [Meiothermus sp.]|nr:hypothetical protein [Meiothermus sp.]